MNKQISIMILLIISLFLLNPVFAEKTDKEKEIEDVYLQNPEILIMEKQGHSGDRYTQLESLKSIESYLNSLRSDSKSGDSSKGDQPIDPAKIPPPIEDLLIYLGSQGSLIIAKKGNVVTNDFPEVRRKACELLGWVRTDKAKESLIRFLIEDIESTVKAEAAWALGEYAKYEGDKKGEITYALAMVIEREKVDNPDNNLAFAVILSMEKIAGFYKGALPHPNGYIALIKIAQGNYIGTVTKKALEVIQKLGRK